MPRPRRRWIWLLEVLELCDVSIFLLLFRKKSKEKPQGFQGVPKVPKQLLMEAEALYKTIHLVP